MVNAKGFKRSFPGVFEALSPATLGALAIVHQEQFLRKMVVSHANYMSCPLKLSLHQYGVHAGQGSMSKDLRVGNFVT